MSPLKKQPEPHMDESAPPVSFDIALGEKYTDIDFDYRAYIDYLRAKGLNDNQISKASINFIMEGCGLFSPNLNSGYGPKTNRTHVVVYQDSNSKSVNNHITHEAQHMIDQNLGIVNNYENTLFNIMHTSKEFAEFAAPCSVVGFVLSRIFNNNEMLHFSLTSCALAMAGIALSGTIYLLDPGEKRARKSASDNKTPFIKLNIIQKPRPIYTESSDWIPNIPDMEW